MQLSIVANVKFCPNLYLSSMKTKILLREFDLFEAKLVVYLKPAPVRDHDHVDILEAGADGDDDPGDEQAVVPQVSPEYEQEGAHHTEERVKHSVLDDGANTNVLKIQLRLFLISLSCS